MSALGLSVAQAQLPDDGVQDASGSGSGSGFGFGKPQYDFAAPPASAPQPRWIRVPRAVGRLTSDDIGLVINTADPYSVEVGAFYIEARKLAPEQVLRIALPLREGLTPATE